MTALPAFGKILSAPARWLCFDIYTIDGEFCTSTSDCIGANAKSHIDVCPGLSVRCLCCRMCMEINPRRGSPQGLFSLGERCKIASEELMRLPASTFVLVLSICRVW